MGKIRILNAAGVEVFSADNFRTGEKISLPDLDMGMYFVQWIRPDGYKISRKLLHIRE